MMRVTSGLVALLLALAGAAPASAHRLDEYLQAVRVDVRPERVVVELDLTPGASLAPEVLAALDPNADGAIDPSEAEGYAAGVMRRLEMSVDDRRIVASLVSQIVPSVDEVCAGTGVISLVARADVEHPRGRHRLRLSNHYRPDVSAYLANALRPDSRTITIESQTRDPRQQTLTIDYVVDGPAGARGSAWTALAVLLIGGCGWWRRQQKS
jgi:hypothetical protein